MAFLLALPNRLFGTIENTTLIAVPLFIFMGVMLEKSRLSEDLLESMADLFGNFRSGLGISVVLVGALLAASTGIVGATVVTMGLMSLPTMLKRGYSSSQATGVIAATGYSWTDYSTINRFGPTWGYTIWRLPTSSIKYGNLYA
jgi:TRAP-type mannitol/chloroaromatic compound transport system permease large subunit